MMERQTDLADSAQIVVVTGLAGAGRSTAVNCLEDIGFEAIDNLPLSLLPRLLSGPPLERPLALGIDVRNRDFSVEALTSALDDMAGDPNRQVDLLFLDCAQDVLVRRYSETRRPHPLSRGEPPNVGIDRDVELLAPVREKASILIDTTDLSPHDLRDEIGRLFGHADAQGMSVSVQSFSYRRGLPRGADMVFDVRFLNNPHWEPALRAQDGRAQAVADYVEADDRFAKFFEQVSDLVQSLLPAFRDEGKSSLTIAFGCTGGQHRSVAVAEMLTKALEGAGWQVSKRHRELDRRGVKGAGDSGETDGVSL